jgi:hypothetical protein
LHRGWKQGPEHKEHALGQNVHQKAELVGHETLAAQLVATKVFGVLDSQFGVSAPGVDVID